MDDTECESADLYGRRPPTPLGTGEALQSGRRDNHLLIVLGRGVGENPALWIICWEGRRDDDAATSINKTH
jgi:hypothetical protein